MFWQGARIAQISAAFFRFRLRFRLRFQLHFSDFGSDLSSDFSSDFRWNVAFFTHIFPDTRLIGALSFASRYCKHRSMQEQWEITHNTKKPFGCIPSGGHALNLTTTTTKTKPDRAQGLERCFQQVLHQKHFQACVTSRYAQFIDTFSTVYWHILHSLLRHQSGSFSLLMWGVVFHCLCNSFVL